MFSVIFEVHPGEAQWDAYLGIAKLLRPELEEIEGFLENVRYRSLLREGWILSLSDWEDEKALVRWRTRVRHHEAQERGRGEVLSDYHLRVGQFVADSRLPEGQQLVEQRLDETRAGEGTAVTLITVTRPPEWKETTNPYDCAEWMGLSPYTVAETTSWDIFEAVLTPGDLVLLISWPDDAAARRFENHGNIPDGARVRRVRVIRDYGMFDRREAPQYYPDAAGRETIHV
ncbi:antibiotic biosynthesis monooxygenase [Methylobacterium sp. 1030]|uniref:antibiotic biosynthesis monooxygenase family protein n=1 Tax=Methylobacterium sp. 1030 TaxID=3156404 RepID=UPI0033927138